MEKNCTDVSLTALTHSIIVASERAARLARVIRKEDELFQLLVEEKTEGKNERFLNDFKTLTDVLVQESVRRELGAKVGGTPA